MFVDAMAALIGALPSYFHKQIDKNATVIPVGLDFGPTKITTSFSIDEDVYITSVDSDAVYKDFFQETLRKKVQSHLDFVEKQPSQEALIATQERGSEPTVVFAKLIEEARWAGVMAIEDFTSVFKVMAITVPEHWDAPTISVVSMAASRAGQHLDAGQILKTPRAIQLTYEMDKHAAGKNLTLMVYFHKSHLHLLFGQMGDFALQGQAYFPGLGEDAIRQACAVGGAVDSNDDKSTNTESNADNTASQEDINTETRVYRHQKVDMQPVQETLQRFLLLMMPPNHSNPTSNSSDQFKDAVRDLNYIILDGEATPSGLRALYKVIYEGFADMEWICVWGKGYCGAWGAQMVANGESENTQSGGNREDSQREE